MNKEESDKQMEICNKALGENQIAKNYTEQLQRIMSSREVEEANFEEMDDDDNEELAEKK